MSFNLYDLKDLDLQELSDQESRAVIGGDKFGCIIGGITSAFAGPAAVVRGCIVVSSIEDSIDSIL